jgi:hypothetical protein
LDGLVNSSAGFRPIHPADLKTALVGTPGAAICAPTPS